MNGLARLASMCTITAIGLAFCHPVDPPVPPPKPTDPTSLAQAAPAEVIDASVVTDGGGGGWWDGAGFEPDAGASRGRAASP